MGHFWKAAKLTTMPPTHTKGSTYSFLNAIVGSDKTITIFGTEDFYVLTHRAEFNNITPENV